MEFLPLESVRAIYDVNLFGLLAVTQLCLPHLRAARGRIINISSIASLMDTPFNGPYSATKASSNALSAALRMELRPFGICVSVIICGSSRTAIWETGRRTGTEIWRELPPEAEQLYGTALRRAADSLMSTGESGFPPEEAALTIAKVLTSKRPKPCYYAGGDAHAFRIVRRLSTERMRDWLALRVLGLERSD